MSFACNLCNGIVANISRWCRSDIQWSFGLSDRDESEIEGVDGIYALLGESVFGFEDVIGYHMDEVNISEVGIKGIRTTLLKCLRLHLK